LINEKEQRGYYEKDKNFNNACLRYAICSRISTSGM